MRDFCDLFLKMLYDYCVAKQFKTISISIEFNRYFMTNFIAISRVSVK